MRTESLVLAMLMHWNINAAREISADVFLGLPAGRGAAVPWSGVMTQALVALLAIPALKAAPAGSNSPR